MVRDPERNGLRKHAGAWQTTLRGVELVMARILKKHGPIMQRTEFERLSMEEGIKRATFWVYLDYSPIIERYGSGVYGLRGTEATPGEIESLVPTRRTAGVRLDHGWTNDRQIWISYRLSEAMINSGVVSIPPGLRQFLEGQFELHAADGAAIGTAVIKGTSAWGLGPFFRRRGGEVSDTLVLRFSLPNRCATAQIGDEGLVDTCQALLEPLPEAVPS